MNFQHIFQWIVELSVWGSLPTILLLLFFRMCQHTALFEYRTLTVVSLLFLVPVYQGIGELFHHFNLLPFELIPNPITNQQLVHSYIEDVSLQESTVISLTPLIPYVWLVGIFVSVVWYVSRWLTFRKNLNEYAVSKELDRLWQDTKNNMGIEQNIPLFQSDMIGTPMVLGLFSPIVVIPSTAVEESLLPSMLTHELVHFVRKDLWVKWYLLLLKIFHWFNPVVCFLTKEVERTLEYSCDDKVLDLLGEKERRNYSYAILYFTQKNENFHALSLSCEKVKSTQKLKRRFENMLGEKKSTSKVQIALMSSVLLLGLSFPAYSYAKELQKGQEIEQVAEKDEPVQALEIDIIQYIHSLTPVDYGNYSICLEDKEQFSTKEWDYLLESAEEGKILIFDNASEQVAHWQEVSQENKTIIVEMEGKTS